jgi:hypothetical protein
MRAIPSSLQSPPSSAKEGPQHEPLIVLPHYTLRTQSTPQLMPCCQEKTARGAMSPKSATYPLPFRSSCASSLPNTLAPLLPSLHDHFSSAHPSCLSSLHHPALPAIRRHPRPLLSLKPPPSCPPPTHPHAPAPPPPAPALSLKPPSRASPPVLHHPHPHFRQSSHHHPAHVVNPCPNHISTTPLFLTLLSDQSPSPLAHCITHPSLTPVAHSPPPPSSNPVVTPGPSLTTLFPVAHLTRSRSCSARGSF